MVGKAEASTPESALTGYHVRATFLQANSQDPVRASDACHYSYLPSELKWLPIPSSVLQLSQHS